MQIYVLSVMWEAKKITPQCNSNKDKLKTLVQNFMKNERKPCFDDVNTRNKWDVRRVPCQNGMARPQVADRGDGLQLWRVAANTFNKQPWTANKGWTTRLRVGRGTNTSP
jgi:hypothetical protein